MYMYVCVYMYIYSHMLYMYTIHIFSHPITGHLDYFWFFAIVNNGEMNFLIQLTNVCKLVLFSFFF